MINRIQIFKARALGNHSLVCLPSIPSKLSGSMMKKKKTRQIGCIDTGGMCCIAGLLESFRGADMSVNEDGRLDTVYLARLKADNRSFTKLSA